MNKEPKPNSVGTIAGSALAVIVVACIAVLLIAGTAYVVMRLFGAC